MMDEMARVAAEEHIAAMAQCQLASQDVMQYPYGAGAMAQVNQWSLDHVKYQQDQRASQAIAILQQAAVIRADADLMTVVRAYIREQRDSLLGVLDQVGE